MTVRDRSNGKAVVLGAFQKRMNRFVAAVDVGGRAVMAHVPNSGRMRELLVPGARVSLRPASGPGRKTRFDLWGVLHGEIWVCVDARAANGVVERMLKKALAGPDTGRAGIGEEMLGALIRGISGYRREVAFGSHRFDFALQKGDKRVPVEVKSVNLVRGETALFPDAPTERGRRHMQCLAGIAAMGGEAYAVFVAQRGDARRVAPNVETDPDFTAALASAKAAGVGLLAIGCDVTPTGITPARALPLIWK